MIIGVEDALVRPRIARGVQAVRHLVGGGEAGGAEHTREHAAESSCVMLALRGL